MGTQLGTELFPQVDSGKFVLRFRTPPGTNYELTRQAWLRCLEAIDERSRYWQRGDLDGLRAGQQAFNYGANNMLLFMRGPDDGQMRVALRTSSGVELAGLRERLRKRLPERLRPWFADLLKQEGLSPEDAAKRARQMTFGFEPNDIVSEVAGFGSPTPIEIVMCQPRSVGRASPCCQGNDRDERHSRAE